MAVINIDDAYILGETGAQVDKVTGLFTKDEDTTSGEKAFAQLNIGTAGSNRNLLDNPFFQVNQRGWTSGTANAAFTVDRWKMSSAFGTKQVTVNADGTITFDGLFFQKFEPHFIAGQVVTISYMTADGNVVSTTGTIGTTEGYAVGNAAFGLYYRPSTGVCDFQIQANNLTLRACKVELGSVSTLANDVPPEYGTELLKCMRYFIRIKGDPIGSGYVTTGLNQAYIHIPTPVPMRTAPTASINGSMYIRGTGATWNVSSVTVPSTSLQPTNGVSVIAAVSATQVMAVGAYMSSANSYIDLTADL